MAKYSVSIPLESKRVDNNFSFEIDGDDDLNISGFSGSNHDLDHSSTLTTSSRNNMSKDDSSRNSDSPTSDMSQQREDSG